MKASFLRNRLPVGLMILALAGPSYAHAPIVEQNDSSVTAPVLITWRIDTSVAYYGYLNSSGDVDSFTFTVSEEDAAGGVTLHVGSLVPACATYRSLRPSIAITGPRQASLTPAEPDTPLPFARGADDTGLAVLTNPEQGEMWHEPYSGKNYYWQRGLDLRLTRPGEYWIHLWEPSGQMGDYVLEMGTRERWGLRELGRALRYMPRLLADKEIHDAACRKELKRQEPAERVIGKTPRAR